MTNNNNVIYSFVIASWLNIFLFNILFFPDKYVSI